MRAYLGIIEAVSAAAILVGLFLFGMHVGAKGVQAKWDHATVEVQKATAIAEAKSRATEQAYSTQLAKAQNEHTIALQKSQKAAAVLTTRVVSLRDQLAANSRDLPGYTADACSKYAATANTVLGELSAEAVGLAKAAQGHADDSLMYQSGWPKQKE